MLGLSPLQLSAALAAAVAGALEKLPLAAAAAVPGPQVQSSGPLVAESSIEGVRRLGTESFLPDDTGTMMSTNGAAVTYLRYGKIPQWGNGVLSPAEIDLSAITSATPVKVAAGWYQQCALLDDGKVACWGNGGMNHYGARGDEAKTHSNGAPLIVQMDDNGVLQDLDNIVDITSGTHHTCAVKNDRSLVCFGADDVANRVNPYFLGTSDETRVRFVAATGSVTTVVSEANEVRHFHGNNADPQHVAPHPITQLVNSNDHACYLMDMPDESATNMRCFGSNGSGQLGDGSTSASRTTMVTPTGLDSKLSFISAGMWGATCAIKASDNSQWCWGYNGDTDTIFKLGGASGARQLVPARVITTGHLDQTLIHSIHQGAQAGYVLLTDGTVHSWGSNIANQLGIGDSDTNTIVSGADSAVAVFGAGRQELPTEPANWQPPNNWPNNGATPAPTPSYARGPFGSNSCPPGYEVITTQADCLSAYNDFAKLVTTTDGPVQTAKCTSCENGGPIYTHDYGTLRPTGCLQHSVNREININPGVGGNSGGNDWPICIRRSAPTTTAPIRVEVGPSPASSKVLTVPGLTEAHECPSVVDQNNWDQDACDDNGSSHCTVPDTFSVSVSGNEVTILRTDADGHWALNLVFYCGVAPAVSPIASPAPTQAPTQAPTFPTITASKVRVQLRGRDFLHLAELMVFDQSGNNVALSGIATQSSTHRNWASASIVNNGNLNDYTHTNEDQGAWVEIDLGSSHAISKVEVVNRQDCCGARLDNSDVVLMDSFNVVVASYHIASATNGQTFDIPVSLFTDGPTACMVECSFRDNQYGSHGPMTPKRFGSDFICGACQHIYFKMAVFNQMGVQTASKYFSCPQGGLEIGDLTEDQYDNATVFHVTNYYPLTSTNVGQCSFPSEAPTASPTSSPSTAPTTAPTQAPTSTPTQAPTQAPTSTPTQAPTQGPTTTPTQAPTSTPTQAPTSPGPWSLTFDNSTTSFSSGASNEIEVDFIVGAGREVSIALYETCDAEGNEIEPGAIFSRTVTPVPEKSNSTHSMKKIGYNFNKTALIGSVLWNSTADTLSFCQVTSLVTTGTSGAEWVIMEDRREIEIRFDLTANFVVNVTLEDETIESANETVSFDDQVKAYKCLGESTDSFVEDDTPLPPNTELAVCVESENDSVNLAKLTNMVIEQDVESVDVVDSDGDIVIPAITSVDDYPDGIMVITRVPLDKFNFETGENITISGKVELELTSGRRLRALNEDNAAAAEVEEVGYTVTVNLLSEGDGMGEVQAPIGSSDGYTISGKSLGALGLMISAVIGLVM